MRESRDRRTMWNWRVWGEHQRPEELWLGSLAGQGGNFRFEGEGMGRSELPAVETNTDVGLGCPRYPKKQSASVGGGSPTEQQVEPGNKAFTSPIAGGHKRQTLGP